VLRFPSPSRRAMTFLIAAPFAVVACTGAVADDGDSRAAAAASLPATVEVADPQAAGDAEQAEATTWLDIELTDSVSGETFTLASLDGQVVAIEPMALWCTNCKVQQDNVAKAYDEIEASGVRYISLGIDPNENPASLATYADRRGYDWSFVQAPKEFSRALSDLFGPQILSAPSTPLIVLDESGEVFVQEWGFHGPDKLLSILDEATA
jgi:cytochrome oxidase Cu insertion factor (SCO1/SenC/PrrC family)